MVGVVKKSVSRNLKPVPYKTVLEMGGVEHLFSSLPISILSCVFAIKILILFWLAKAEYKVMDPTIPSFPSTPYI